MEHPECHRAKCLLYQQILTETQRGKLSKGDRDHLQNAYVAAMFLQGFVISTENTIGFPTNFSATNHPQIKKWKYLLFRYLKSKDNALFFSRLLAEIFGTKFTVVSEMSQQDREVSLLLLYTFIDHNANNPDVLKYILKVLYFLATTFFDVHFEGIERFLGDINEASFPKNLRVTIQTCISCICSEEKLIFFLHQIEQHLKIKINFHVGDLPLPDLLPQEPQEEFQGDFVRYNFFKTS